MPYNIFTVRYWESNEVLVKWKSSDCGLYNSQEHQFLLRRTLKRTLLSHFFDEIKGTGEGKDEEWIKGYFTEII